MREIDWANTPLEEFSEQWRCDERLSFGEWYRPQGEGRAQELLGHLIRGIGSAYANLLPMEVDEEGEIVEDELYIRPEEIEGKRYIEGKDLLGGASAFYGSDEVPVDRDGRREYRAINTLTLSDLPDVLSTLMTLEREYHKRLAKEAERRAAERKNRERVRAKERRKLKKLGEW